MLMTFENLKATIAGTSPDKLKTIYNESQKIAKSENLKISNSPIRFTPFPKIIDSFSTNKLFSTLNTFIDILVKTEQQTLKNTQSEIFTRLYNSLSEGGKHLVDQCSYESDFSLERRHRRVDGFWDIENSRYSILEVNQAAPLAINFHDIVQKIAVFTLNELGFNISENLIAPKMMDWFIDEYKSRYNNRFPHTIALVIEHGYPPKFTDLPGMAKRIEKLFKLQYGESISIISCFPYELKLNNEKIFLNNREIDMIWRNSVYLNEYRKTGKDISDYEKICSEPDHFLIINSTRSWLTRTKELFAIFSDPDIMKNIDLTKEESNVLNNLVPLTINLKYSPEWYNEILHDKGSWISKPSDSGFGAGIEFGINHSEYSWSNILKIRSNDFGFVFQKFITYPETRILDLNPDGSFNEIISSFDFCPQHINGEFINSALCRVVKQSSHDAQKMNLSGVGRILPIVIQ
jgi:hypothetical protein